MHKDHIPRFRDTRVRSRSTLELFNMTKDTSDYLWYTTRWATHHFRMALDIIRLLTVLSAPSQLQVRGWWFTQEAWHPPCIAGLKPWPCNACFRQWKARRYDCLVPHILRYIRLPMPLRCTHLMYLSLPGSGHGTNIEKSFVFHQPIALGAGINHVTILCMTIGLPVQRQNPTSFISFWVKASNADV